MTDFRKKHLIALVLLFFAGLVVVFSISDRRSPTLKALNAAFDTDISARAKPIYTVTRPANFHGDGISFFIYHLDDRDADILRKDLASCKSYAADSKFGNIAISDLSRANAMAPHAYPKDSFEDFRFYFLDRSPKHYDALMSNYDALLFNEESQYIIYLTVDS